MKRLTKAEEEIMQIIWRLGKCTIKQIREDIGGHPLPPHSSISTIVRILEQKEFVTHEKLSGRTFAYFPKVQKEDYSKQTLQKFVNEYFDGSMNRLVSFIVEEDDLKLKEVEELMELLKQKK